MESLIKNSCSAENKNQIRADNRHYDSSILIGLLLLAQFCIDQ